MLCIAQIFVDSFLKSVREWRNAEVSEPGELHVLQGRFPIASAELPPSLPTLVNAGLKLPENQRFEIVGFLALSGRILWFDPRREYSSIPTANSRSRRAQGLSRLAASSRPPAGLGLDWPEHGGILDRIGAGGAHHIVGKFKPLVLGEIHAAGDNTAEAGWRLPPSHPRCTMMAPRRTILRTSPIPACNAARR
jgi:hypothetical protein